MIEGYDLKRVHERKTYTAEVLFSHNHRMFSGTMRNISLGGAFIEIAHTHMFAVGDSITLSIPFTTGEKHIKRNGHIKWMNSRGFAVAFE
jgi:Tfp pilus assembly protein PilZ